MEIHADLPLLRMDEHREIRVGKTGVIYKLVVEAYEGGASAEEIAREIYSTLSLADVYGALAYYFRHQDEVQEYMHQWDEDAERTRRMIESQPEYQVWKRDLKERLVQRQALLEPNNAAAPQG